MTEAPAGTIAQPTEQSISLSSSEKNEPIVPRADGCSLGDTNWVSSTPNKSAKMKIKEKKKKKKKKRPPHKSKMITGYIIYASEIRKEVIKKYPDRDFGDISKLVGTEWKNLPQEEKTAYEKRAQEQNAKSKAIAAEAFELKKLADAAEERAKEQEMSRQTADPSQQLPNTCNGCASNGHSQTINNRHLMGDLPQSPAQSIPPSPIQQMQSQQNNCQRPLQTSSSKTTMQQPLQIIQQQQEQQTVTTVQYCNNNCSSQQHSDSSQSPPPHIHYQRNNIVYRKPATVRLRPKDATTQTESIVWIKLEPKKPLRFSQKFMDYLSSNNNVINGNSDSS